MNIFFVIGSVTTASQLLRRLQKNGVQRAAAVSTPIAISNGSCSYSIKCNEREFDRVYKIIKQKGVKIKGIYKEVEEGYEYENIS